MGERKFAVLLAKPELFKPLVISHVLAPARGIPLQDAVSSARSCWGFLLENADEPAAQGLAARFDDAGLSVLVVPRESIPVLPPVQLIPSPKTDILPDRIVLISAMAFKQRVMKAVKVKEGPTQTQQIVSMGLMMATGLPIKLGGKKKTVEKNVESSELLFYADLILRNPSERFRVDAQKFDYSCLGSKMLYNIAGNFRLLLGEWVKNTPAARLNHGTRVILDNKPLREMGYASLEEMERESRWLLALVESGWK